MSWELRVLIVVDMLVGGMVCFFSDFVGAGCSVDHICGGWFFD